MADKAHIWGPKDDSLFERVQAYRYVYQQYMRSEASLKMADDEEWQDTLGDLADIEQAYQISIDSLKLATENISLDEMTFAKEQGLIDDNELIEFVQNKRQQDMQEMRESSYEDSDEDYDGHSM